MCCRYAPPHPCSIWPLSANILDPVRLSLVADGPALMLEVVKWFAGEMSEATRLPVVRMKNKFGLPREEVPDGYRDVKLFVAYTSPTGLGIVGEIQARHVILFICLYPAFMNSELTIQLTTFTIKSNG